MSVSDGDIPQRNACMTHTWTDEDDPRHVWTLTGADGLQADRCVLPRDGTALHAWEALAALDVFAVQGWTAWRHDPVPHDPYGRIWLRREVTP